MNNNQSGTNKVKEYIFNCLEMHTLQVGSRLPSENTLSDELNVSRNSVREALQALKGIGLLDSSRGSGYTVIGNVKKSLSDSLRAMMAIKPTTLTDISQVREAIEVKSVELAINCGVNHEDISYLEQCIDQIQTNAKNHTEEITKYDINFHRKLAQMSGNEFLKNFIIALSDFANRYILISWNSVTEKEKEELIRSHLQIIHHLKELNLENTINEIRNHYVIANKIIKNHSTLHDEIRRSNINLLDRLYSEGFTDEQIYAKFAMLVNKEAGD